MVPSAWSDSSTKAGGTSTIAATRKDRVNDLPADCCCASTGWNR
jgi:hypothetical protein